MKATEPPTLSTSRQCQFRDLLRIATLASESALSLNESVSPKVRSNLHIKWLCESLDDIVKGVELLDLRRVAAHDAAGSNGDTLIHELAERIRDALERRYGASYCLQDLFKQDLRGKTFTPETVGVLGRVGRNVKKMHLLVRRISSPRWYPVRDGRLAKWLLALFIVTIPIWYQFGPHGQSFDLNLLRDETESIFARLFELGLFLWNSALAIPSIFLVGAGVLSLMQRHCIVPKPSGKLVEDKLRALAKELEFLSAASATSPVRIKIMTGDITTAIGRNITQVVKSKVSGAFNSIKNDLDDDNRKFLREVGSAVEQLGDKSAAEHYENMVENLKAENKSMAKTMWEGLIRIAPDIGKIAGAATAVGKLFG